MMVEVGFKGKWSSGLHVKGRRRPRTCRSINGRVQHRSARHLCGANLPPAGFILPKSLMIWSADLQPTCSWVILRCDSIITPRHLIQQHLHTMSRGKSGETLTKAAAIKREGGHGSHYKPHPYFLEGWGLSYLPSSKSPNPAHRQ